MPSTSRTGVQQVTSRLVLVPALLWLASGGVPRYGGGSVHRERFEPKALQDSEAHGFTVDAVSLDAPVVTAPGPLVNTSTFVIRGTAKPGTTVFVWLKAVGGYAMHDMVKNPEGTWSLTVSTPAEGLHLVEAQATDAVGNVSPSSGHSFTVDTMPPETPVVTEPGALVNTHTPVIRGTAEPGTTVFVWLDGTEVGAAVANPVGTWSFTPGFALAEGVHWVVAFATDAVGNVSPNSKEYSFTVDTVPPEAAVMTDPCHSRHGGARLHGEGVAG